MRTWIRAALGLVALPVAVVFSLSGCQDTLAGVLPPGSIDYCTVMADPPVKAGSAIAAPGRYRCDGKGADTIKITVTMQKKSNNTWKKVKSATFVAHGANTSRDRSEGTRTRNVTTKCASGQFRTLVHAVETSNGHTKVFDVHSVPVPNPCETAF